MLTFMHALRPVLEIYERYLLTNFILAVAVLSTACGYFKDYMFE